MVNLVKNNDEMAFSVRAHIDSVKSQSFVHFRWCAHIPQLYAPADSAGQSAASAFTLNVIGCSDNEHWRRKYKDSESLNTGISLVKHRLNISKVLSPFEVSEIAALAPQAAECVVEKSAAKFCPASWQKCDEVLWSLSRHLSLMTERQLKSAMSTEFPQPLRGTPRDTACCGNACGSPHAQSRRGVAQSTCCIHIDRLPTP